MKLAIMQPYLFPYLGYYQLIGAVDRFVIYDDVNYIKNGWINRNRLVLSGAINYFTVPLHGASPFQKIHEVKIQPDDQWRRKLLMSLRQSYAKAPEFAAIFELASKVLETPNDSISDIATLSLTEVARYLDLGTEFVLTSRIYENDHLTAEDRVIDICRRNGARTYVNLPGGRDLYDCASFAAAGVALEFIAPSLPPYRHAITPFAPGLSILDALMWNDIKTVRAMIRGEGAA